MYIAVSVAMRACEVLDHRILVSEDSASSLSNTVSRTILVLASPFLLYL